MLKITHTMAIVKPSRPVPNSVTFQDLRDDVASWKTKDILMFKVELDWEIDHRVLGLPGMAVKK